MTLWVRKTYLFSYMAGFLQQQYVILLTPQETSPVTLPSNLDVANLLPVLSGESGRFRLERLLRSGGHAAAG